jgi:hypothetical protein
MVLVKAAGTEELFVVLCRPAIICDKGNLVAGLNTFEVTPILLIMPINACFDLETVEPL